MTKTVIEIEMVAVAVKIEKVGGGKAGKVETGVEVRLDVLNAK